jgi:uncharacterized membrane protein
MPASRIEWSSNRAAEIMSNATDSQSTASFGSRPIYALLASFSIACFVGAFVMDIVYWRSMSFMWVTFSVWLLAAGLVAAALAVIAGIIAFIVDRRVRMLGPTRTQVLTYVLVIVLSLFNAFVHSRDGYTAVVPTGIILSGVVVLLVMITGWMNRKPVYRLRLGVAE